MVKLMVIVSFVWAGIVLAGSEVVLPECGIICADKTCGAADINCFCKLGNSSINTFEQCIGTTCGPLDFQAAHSWVSSRCGRTEFGLLVQRACDVGEVACHSGCIPSDGVCCSSNSGWCDPGEACCNSGCMPDDGICCGSQYCYAGNYCCNNAQYTNECMESSASCCDSTESSCGSGCIPTGTDCCPDGGYCDSGEECCDDGYCIPTGATCCGTGDGSYCDSDQDCCNGKCIESGATCCDAGMTACGDGCMPSGSVCCDNGAGYCDSGEACCNGKCITDTTPCCDSGWTACTTGCMPVGSVCCSDGGYCDAGLICSADKCWESSATSKPTTSISRASTTARSATDTGIPTSAGFTATGGGLTLPTESASSGSVSSSSSVSFTSLTLVLTTVDIVTPTGPVSQPDLTNTPLYAGTGSLLGDECSTTEFTLVDAGSTVFYAPFVGCVSDRPECCPWTVALTTTVTVTSNGATSVVTSTPPAGNHQDVAYPFALESGQQALSACPADYYSIAGSCCPSNYQPYGAALGGATPCFSSLGNYASPPTLTAGLAGQPTDTSQPTSAVINVVWAMQYEIKKKSDDLSTGAKAGIGVGVPVGAIALGLLGFVIWRQTRKRGDSDTATVSTVQSPPPQQMHQAPPGFAVYPAPGSNNSFAPTGTIPSQNTGGSLLSHNTQGMTSELSGNGSNPHNSAYMAGAGAGAASYNNPPSFHGSGGGSPVYGISNGQGQYPFNYNQQQAPSGSPPPQGQPFYPSGGNYEGQQYGYGGQGAPQPSPPHQPSHGPWYPPNPQPQR